MRKLKLVLLFILLALLLSAGQRAVMGQGPPSQGGVLIRTDGGVDPVGEEALIQDAKMYASRFGVDLDEAIRRLELQDDIGDLNAKLADKEANTFAGLWIQHQPEYRIIVQFTHDGEKIIRPYIENGLLTNLVEVQTASTTLKELQNGRAAAERIASQLGVHVHSATDVMNNHVELYVLDREELNAALRRANMQLPANVEVIVVSEFPKDAIDIYGGMAQNVCTSGFSVRERSTGRLGVSTAGHCGDNISINGVQLTVRNRLWFGAYDVQWMQPPAGHRIVNWVWDGYYGRAMYSVKFRSQQSVGTWVCKYGKASGYGCGTIAQTDFDGINVRVTGVTVQEGDSGGPWFYNNTAYGTTISYLGADSIYATPDQLGVMTVDILTN
jgi:hypothetical protein